MILYDEESRSFSVIDDQREFGITKTINNISKGLNAASKVAVSGRKLVDKLGPERETFWGNFNGKNRRIRENRKNRHEREMARIAAGTDIASQIRDRGRYAAQRKNKELDAKIESARDKAAYKRDIKMRKMDTKDRKMDNKYALKGRKLDSEDKRMEHKYDLKGKSMDMKHDLKGRKLDSKYALKGRRLDSIDRFMDNRSAERREGMKYLDKALERRNDRKLRKYDSRDKKTELKSNERMAKIQNRDKRSERGSNERMNKTGLRYDLANKMGDRMVRMNETNKDYKLNRYKEGNSTTAIPWKKRI